jgi:hypothetical protein
VDARTGIAIAMPPQRASTGGNQARLSATATNDAPSTIVVVATTIATTRVQAKILDCSKVTRLTTRAKRRVRMNNSLHSARHELPQLAGALLFNNGRDPTTHLRQKKDSDFPNERLKWRNDAKRSHSRDDIIHLMDQFDG